MENNIKEKAKPKVTYKEVKRKMKKLTLTQKNRIKEDKKEQKAKDKAEKQRVSQRVKININIPSSVNKSGHPIFNPLNQSSREQISLLNSINEQLKNKNKPASINDMFKIPARTIETQTEPTPTYSQGSQTRVKQREQSTQQEPQMNRVIETQTEREDEDFTQDMGDINNELQQRLAQTRLPEQFSPKVETPIPIIREPTIPIISKPKEKSNEGLIEKVSKLTEEQLRAEEEALTQKMAASLMENPANASPLMEIEKVTQKGRPKMTDEEKKQRAEERAREREVERQIDEAEARLVEEEKQRQKETGMQRRAREKSQVEEQFQIDLKDAEKGLAEEMALRKKMNDEEIANTPAIIRKIQLNQLLAKQQSLRQQVEDERLRLKALKEQNEKDREVRRKNYEEYLVLEKQKELKEKVEKDIVLKGTGVSKRKQPTGENVSEKVKEIEARRKANEADNLTAEKKKEQEQIKLVQAEYKRKEKEQKEIRGLNNAFNMLIQFSNPIEERKLTEAYNTGFLKKEDIRNKLKELKNSSTNKKIFTAKEIDEMFNQR